VIPGPDREKAEGKFRDRLKDSEGSAHRLLCSGPKRGVMQEGGPNHAPDHLFILGKVINYALNFLFLRRHFKKNCIPKTEMKKATMIHGHHFFV
jgi:hypothetical protein